MSFACVLGWVLAFFAQPNAGIVIYLCFLAVLLTIAWVLIFIEHGNWGVVRMAFLMGGAVTLVGSLIVLLVLLAGALRDPWHSFVDYLYYIANTCPKEA